MQHSRLKYDLSALACARIIGPAFSRHIPISWHHVSKGKSRILAFLEDAPFLAAGFGALFNPIWSYGILTLAIDSRTWDIVVYFVPQRFFIALLFGQPEVT